MEKRFGISRVGLKYIALISMVCDHAGIVFAAPGSLLYTVLRYGIGRMSFPLFAILFLEGAHYNQHKWRQALLLLLSALAAEPAFDFVIGKGSFYNSNFQNVMWTWLILSLLFLFFDHVDGFLSRQKEQTIFYELFPYLCVVLAGITAQRFSFDYGMGGVVCVGVGYLLYKNGISLFTCGCVVIFGMLIFTGTFGVLLALPFLYFYDSVKPSIGSRFFKKYLFYLFYPLHLWVFVGLSIIF